MLEWTEEDWDNVLWSDETSVKLITTRAWYVRRRAGERYKPECVVPKVKGDGGKINGAVSMRMALVQYIK